MKHKPVWEKPNPKEKSKKLTPQQKAKAKRIAKQSGTVYPSLVANIQAARKKHG